MNDNGDEYADEYIQIQSGIPVHFYNGGRLAGSPSSVPPTTGVPDGYILIIILGVPTWGALPLPKTWVLLSTQTASASSSINFTGLTSAYSRFSIVLSGVTYSAGTLRGRTSSNNGSSYDAGATDYNTSGGNTNWMTLSSASSATIGQQGEIEIWYPSQTSAEHVVSSRLWLDNALTTASNSRRSTTAVNAFRLLPTTGTITAGTFILYGLQL